MVPRLPVFGVVLAAGESRRMGRPKALLPCGADGETFVARVVRAMTAGGLTEIGVVGRPGDERLRDVVRPLGPTVRYLENADAELGQLSSILVGVAEAERSSAAALLVMPVDIPLVQPATIAAALHAFRASDAAIVRVTHGHRHGHPVIFSDETFADLRSADVAIGAKAVLRTYGSRVLNLEVPDPSVLRDVDAPEDYRSLFGSDPP